MMSPVRSSRVATAALVVVESIAQRPERTTSTSDVPDELALETGGESWRWISPPAG